TRIAAAAIYNPRAGETARKERGKRPPREARRARGQELRHSEGVATTGAEITREASWTAHPCCLLLVPSAPGGASATPRASFTRGSWFRSRTRWASTRLRLSFRNELTHPDTNRHLDGFNIWLDAIAVSHQRIGCQP